MVLLARLLMFVMSVWLAYEALVFTKEFCVLWWKRNRVRKTTAVLSISIYLCFVGTAIYALYVLVRATQVWSGATQ